MLKPGGRLAFYTIFITPGLPERERRRARQSGPSAAYSRSEPQTLLRSAGFVQIAERDATEEYLRFTRDLLDASERHAKALRESIGEAAFAQRLSQRRAAIAATEAGLLRRSLFVAERPR
ncbi:MAG: hypothetical protein IH958_02755 [Chloroflexi bacterium]|nr:hypothetical protein [Chloroflexota bacterium]